MTETENEVVKEDEKGTPEELQEFVESIERFEEQRKKINKAINEKKAEAESRGFDKKIIGECIKLRKRNPEKVEQDKQILDSYMEHLGM